MSAELIISIISICGTVGLGIFTAIFTGITNTKISRLNNLQNMHEYEKNITYFELSYKDEMWLKEIFDKDEFHKYNLKSQRRILKWWDKYQKQYPPVLLHEQVKFSKHEMIKSMKIGPMEFMRMSKDKDASIKDHDKNGPSDDLPNVEDLF